jgi:hypothetical protein
VLLILSDHCNKPEHDYVLTELDVARGSRKRIIPFHIDSSQPKGELRMYISRLHRIDAVASRERAIDKVVSDFSELA